jgi:hypoxanthine phosphoribosyltransferase
MASEEFEKRILIPSSDIQDRVGQLAQAVVQDFQTSENLILIPVLEGGARFGADMSQALFALGFDLQQTSIKISSYGEKQVSSHDPKVQTLYKPRQFEGKHGLLVEDILDTGYTLQKVLQVLTSEAGFASLTVMCLLAKKGVQKVEVPVKYVGFHIENVWVEGYGIDTAEKGRGNPNIMVVETKKAKKKAQAK